MVHERPLSRRRVYDYLRATEPVAADVTLLTAADRLAARGEGPLASAEMVEAHLELAREMLRRGARLAPRGRRAPLGGDELAAELGIEPGPELGSLAGRARGGRVRGRVSRPRGRLGARSAGRARELGWWASRRTVDL